MELCLRAAQKRHKFPVDDLDDLLTGSEAAENFTANGPFLNAADKVLDDLEVDISLKERKAHLAQSFLYIVFLKDAPAPELLENRL
jgi:hypothetical protein